ncbi:hypothetical protein NliqN6_2583 [Naganishia liquefaciens]|uniref:Uncharacterized protein n=1 Tax=Naganishia liquefaciens TaxID=104408 RepID=A0A8H3TSI6_9TREE|nr:hypothetical protein NliqN6_2583 [Naganishia liquefaciens]
MIVLSIALLALHYCLLPSDFDFMHKPNHFMPGIKREPSHPRDMFANCKLVMFAVDVANIGLNLTEFCLMLPILMAFLAMHLMGGVVLWCSLPVALRPVRLVLQLYQLIFRRASVTDSKALLEKSFTVVPRGQRSIRLWVQNKVVQLAQTKLKQVLGSLPASILDFLAVTDWDEQFERLMIATARVVHYIFFELLPVVFCHDFFYVVSISQE